MESYLRYIKSILNQDTIKYSEKRDGIEKISYIASEINKIIANLHESKKEITNYKKEIIKLNTDLTNNKKEIINYKKELDNLNTNYKNSREELDKINNIKNLEISNLHQKLNDKSAEIFELKSNNNNSFYINNVYLETPINRNESLSSLGTQINNKSLFIQKYANNNSLILETPVTRNLESKLFSSSSVINQELTVFTPYKKRKLN